MKLATLEKVSMAEITAAFNHGFSDYLVKFDASEEYLKKRWRGARVSLADSLGGWRDGKLAALLITGIDDWQGQRTAFNAATCVVPDARGQHFTTAAYEFLIPHFRQRGIEQLLLEVIQENSRAISVYERVGFKKVRGLRCFSGDVQVASDHAPDRVQVEISQQLDLIQAESFHDYPVAWESSFAALQANRNQYEIYQVTKANSLLAYAVVDAGTGRLSSFAVDPDHRRNGLGASLFSKIGEQHPQLKINNIDDRDILTIAFLESCGLRNVINQYEMQMVV